MLHVDAMFRHFPSAKKNHRYLPAIALPQDSIVVDVHFAKSRAELIHKRRDRRLGLFAKMTAWPRVKRHVAWTGCSEARVLRMQSGLQGHGFEFE